MAVSNHLPVLCVPWHSFWEDKFHDLPRHRGEAERSVVPRVVLPTLFKNGHNVSLLPVARNFT